jgi:hypothetical protein
MAGFIVLQDGRAYAASNWAYDTTIEAIAESLPQTRQAQALHDWLLDQRCCVRGMGLGRVDLRELTSSNQQLFEIGAMAALDVANRRGPTGWAFPEHFAGWQRYFQDLVKMIELVHKGEPPMSFNPHMTDLIEPTGRHSGPGWDSET